MSEAPVGIKVIDNCIPDAENLCDLLISSSGWGRSVVSDDETVSNIRTSSTLQLPLFSFTNPDLVHGMNKSVWLEVDAYAREWDFGFSFMENVSVQMYEPGQSYKSHVDSGVGAPRVVSALAYLNTVESGGETYFDNFDYAVKPVAGRVVIFPSNYVYRHQAFAPREGVKVAAAYWARY